MFNNILRVFGILLIIAGTIWALQGLSILPGSFMSGNPQWTINGTVAVVIGAGLFWFGSRKK